VNAIPPWVWLVGAAALPALLLGALAIGACIGGTKISRSHARPSADERWYQDEARDPGELLYEPPTPVRIHPGREAP
jgi:hypothetical protein